jgi:choline kinase
MILVVLAAGMGSRYGGLKQMDRIGPGGEVLLDYSVYDALQSGFDKIVFIIRRDIEQDFRDTVLARMDKKVNYELAYQQLDSLIPPALLRPDRSKPWGTAHALLCAADKIDAPFTVVNADDFYGREAYTVMGAHLSGGETAIVPYKLDNTLSSQGTVTRGVCEVKNGYLVSVEELTAIEKKDGRIINTAPDGSLRELSPDTPVSMNFWGFNPGILDEFKKYFDSFLAANASDPKSECFIPKAADWFIKQGIVKIKSLPLCSQWFGVTYREDREAASVKIAGLIETGVYPAKLW